MDVNPYEAPATSGGVKRPPDSPGMHLAKFVVATIIGVTLGALLIVAMFVLRSRG